MLEQNKRLAKFDKFVKDEKAEIPKIGSYKATPEKVYEEVEIMETLQPKGYDGDEDLTVEDWSKFARESL